MTFMALADPNAGSRVVVAAAATLLIGTLEALAGENLQSFLPSTSVARFVAAELDLRTFDSSLSPRIKKGSGAFESLGLKVSTEEPLRVVLESADEVFVLKVVARGDHNADGIEDLVLCMSESSTQGTMARTQSLLAQKYSNSTPLVVVARSAPKQACK